MIEWYYIECPPLSGLVPGSCSIFTALSYAWQGSHQPGKSGRVREFGGQGKSGKSQGILDGVREKEEKKKKREINKRTRNTISLLYGIDYIEKKIFFK